MCLTFCQKRRKRVEFIPYISDISHQTLNIPCSNVHSFFVNGCCCVDRQKQHSFLVSEKDAKCGWYGGRLKPTILFFLFLSCKYFFKHQECQTHQSSLWFIFIYELMHALFMISLGPWSHIKYKTKVALEISNLQDWLDDKQVSC